MTQAAGKKFDGGKAPVVQGFMQYFPRAMAAVANVSAYGAKKYDVPYSDQNWRRVENGYDRYTDAMGRHLLGETTSPGAIDPESGCQEAAMVAWNAMARLELLLTPPDTFQ